ncbi:uncharacterized LOC729966 homolog isoform X2 [Bubalus kerabau]|uniref:uncharacterized LOC729966 homolog isoform X2 n=1 Tax=Bubalus carabanensis TaxID=3119969 RepID=UPI00244EE827|nr:uncharacterized LOC729966 homolog isoform X2 [Bubalus carabanensis]
MASSQPPPPLLLLALLLLLLLKASDTTSSVPTATSTETDNSTSKPLTSPFNSSSPTVGENHTSQEKPETASTSHPNSSSSESTTSHSPSNSGTTSTTQPTSSQPEPDTHPSSGSPRPEHTVTSPSSALGSVSLATLPWSPTHPKPSTGPPSVSLATTDRTFETSGYELPEMASSGVGTQQRKRMPCRQIYSKEKKEKNKSESKRVKKCA